MLGRIVLSLATILFALAAGPAAAQAKDKVVLLLNWYTYSEHAPFYLGKERGYFDRRASTSTSRRAAAPASPSRRWPRAPRRSATPTCRR
jgi:ABC-type nitrate/sulfonate/bicarbonate transport system substrate-binding protein